MLITPSRDGIVSNSDQITCQNAFKGDSGAKC
eukprot:Gb_02588 [translate_table: standard]